MRKFVFTLVPVMMFYSAFFMNVKEGVPVAPGPMPDDGPYVIYRNDKIHIKYVTTADAVKSVRQDSVWHTEKAGVVLQVNGDEPGQFFTFKLKTELTEEKSEYRGVRKMLVISDIEGNFSAFRKLLQANGVMDKNFNWIFGKNHLVLTGDFFDRGAQVTQVLWLIYALEEKAKLAGGHVHFILGNHEIMNMNGDIRYVNPKYFENAALMGEDYMNLYSDSSELGRWLRTKNVVEKVGDILFAHGGISKEVNWLAMSAARINRTVRPYYADTSYKYPDMKTDLLYSDFGPFWYRGYYTGVRASMGQLDSTLTYYGARYVATGHTVIADTISLLYDGKLINTDVHHASGHSEALLVDGNKLYRVNALGQQFPLKQ